MNNSAVTLPNVLREFIDRTQWTFAKTYALTWPHEYIVRERVDDDLFVKLVRHIRANGLEGPFYDKKFIYYEKDGLLYWTMGAPLEETTIINRCRKDDSYENRLRNGTLPRVDEQRSRINR